MKHTLQTRSHVPSPMHIISLPSLPNLNYGHDVEYVEENGREELSSGLGNNRPKENVTKDVTKKI